MTTPNSACTSCVVVHSQHQTEAVQHHQQYQHRDQHYGTSALQPPKKLHKLCTVVENDKVVVRLTEPEQPQD
jgi:hypothetical protein